MSKPTIEVTVITGTINDGKRSYAVGDQLLVDKKDLERLVGLGKVIKGVPSEPEPEPEPEPES